MWGRRGWGWERDIWLKPPRKFGAGVRLQVGKSWVSITQHQHISIWPERSLGGCWQISLSFGPAQPIFVGLSSIGIFKHSMHWKKCNTNASIATTARTTVVMPHWSFVSFPKTSFLQYLIWEWLKKTHFCQHLQSCHVLKELYSFQLISLVYFVMFCNNVCSGNTTPVPSGRFVSPVFVVSVNT